MSDSNPRGVWRPAPPIATSYTDPHRASRAAVEHARAEAERLRVALYAALDSLTGDRLYDARIALGWPESCAAEECVLDGHDCPWLHDEEADRG